MKKDKRKFFLYARKSTEGDERQIQSLEDQTNVMKKKADSLWIQIVEVFPEAMSAKEPWRYKFNEMIGRIQSWEAEGIISWKLDRLSRNPIDSGNIQYMLQTWVLKQVITNDREYNPEDAGLLMSVENGMSNQFIMDLKKNVKRWMDSKTEKGGFCGQAPEGYLNDRLEKTIITDIDNFPFIRKAWGLMLTWNYSVPQLVSIMNDKWQYKSNKKGRNKITVNWLYGIFSNPFYTWDFLWKWEIKNWNHKQMITWQEYERVQKLIWSKWKTVRAKTREFSYSWMIQCWECWGAIVWVEKHKYVKATWEMKTYIYYRCSKRKKWCKCYQKPVTLNVLEAQINETLESIEILPEFKDWWLSLLKDEFHNVRMEREKLISNLERNEKITDEKLNRLLDLLMDDTISKDQYSIKKEILKDELKAIRRQLDNLKDDKDNSVEKTEDLCELIVNVTNKFNTGSLRDKKTIFSFLGENFHLQDGVLALELHPWLLPLIKQVPIIKREYRRLELTKKGSSKWILKPNSSLILLWSGGPGLNWHTQGLKP